MCMRVLPTCMYVLCLRVWYPQRAEEGAGFPGTVLRDLGAAMWAHGNSIKILFERASAPNHGAISPVSETV